MWKFWAFRASLEILNFSYLDNISRNNKNFEKKTVAKVPSRADYLFFKGAFILSKKVFEKKNIVLRILNTPYIRPCVIDTWTVTSAAMVWTRRDVVAFGRLVGSFAVTRVVCTCAAVTAVTGVASLFANGRDFVDGRSGRCSVSGSVPDSRVIYRCDARRRTVSAAAFWSGGCAAVTEKERRSERDVTVAATSSRGPRATRRVTPHNAPVMSRRGKTSAGAPFCGVNGFRRVRTAVIVVRTDCDKPTRGLRAGARHSRATRTFETEPNAGEKKMVVFK